VSVETRATPRVPDTPPAESPRRSGTNLLLAVCCAAQFMVILDLSIINVALPSIQSSLGFSSPNLQWVIDAYTITFAGFLMLGGRLADHLGQRRVFVVSLLLFGLASLAGGLASSQEVLVAARAFQGFSGAFMAASSLAIITASFAPGAPLNRAIGTWAAMNGLGGSAGMLFGGIIVQFIGWRWVLLINPPIAVAAAFVAWAVVGERRRARAEESFDVAGALTLTVGQLILVYGVVQAGLKGWHTAEAIGPIVLGIVILAMFNVIETRWASWPLIPFKELTKPLRTANTIVLLFSATLFTMWFVSTLYLQQVLGLSPLDTGLVFLPMTLTIAIGATFAGRLVGSFGVRAVLGSGLVMLTCGMLLLTQIEPSGSAVIYVMIPGILTAAGIALSIVPSTVAATQGAKEGQAGLASGLVNTSRQVGGGLGLAVLVTLATQHTSNLIGSGSQVPAALTSGFRLAYLICACLAAAAALLTFVAVPRHTEVRRTSMRGLAVIVGFVLAGFIAFTAAFAGTKGAPIGAYTKHGAYSFVTAPGLHPPEIRDNKRVPDSKLAPGYIFTANFYDLNYPPIVGQSGPLILDRDLQPVWFQPVPEKVAAANLSLQSYQGRPVLAWWQGKVTNTGATENGEYVVVNQHYQPILRLKAKDGWVLTLHEFIIDGEDAWVTANRNIPKDLARWGGAYNGAVIDSAVQEYNLRTGQLVRNWDALDHIPLSQSEATLPTNGFPWDAYHVNSVALTGDGRFLVSMRDTWAAYMVDVDSGKIEWTLGGRNSSFKFGPGAEFEWQHDMRLQPNSVVSVYDDHCCQLTGGGTHVEPTGDSRGLLLKLNEQTHTATLAASYSRGRYFASTYMGDTQPLPNGNVFVGWGNEPYFSEYDKAGHLLFEGVLPGANVTYRAMLEPWVGVPLTDPSGAARRNDDRTTVYASWNGATELRTWKVLAVSGTGPSKVIASQPKSGFETAIAVPAGYDSFEVQALATDGRVLGTSKAFTLPAP
jgi:EmrB/QacA subfamily drug resistance transporter